MQSHLFPSLLQSATQRSTYPERGWKGEDTVTAVIIAEQGAQWGIAQIESRGGSGNKQSGIESSLIRPVSELLSFRPGVKCFGIYSPPLFLKRTTVLQFVDRSLYPDHIQVDINDLHATERASHFYHGMRFKSGRLQYRGTKL
jgi:hypothetical protein